MPLEEDMPILGHSPEHVFRAWQAAGMPSLHACFPQVTEAIAPPEAAPRKTPVPATLTGQEVRALRLRLKLNQAQFATLIGMETKAGVSRLESGSRQPKGTCLAALRLATLLTPGKAKKILRLLSRHYRQAAHRGV